jgi:hypothetical protein
LTDGSRDNAIALTHKPALEAVYAAE